MNQIATAFNLIQKRLIAKVCPHDMPFNIFFYILSNFGMDSALFKQTISCIENKRYNVLFLVNFL